MERWFVLGAMHLAIAALLLVNPAFADVAFVNRSHALFGKATKVGELIS